MRHTQRRRGTGRTATATVAATAAAGAAMALMGPATGAHASQTAEPAAPATTGPVFLEADELPPRADSAWTAWPVVRGLPDPRPFCAERALPATGASHRQFTTDYETGATQIVIEARSASRAAGIVRAVEKSVRKCAEWFERIHPGSTAALKDYGTVGAGDGAHVYGLGSAVPESSLNVHLFGVGRDGATLTFVTWGEMSTLRLAPVTAFRETTATAVNKLHG